MQRRCGSANARDRRAQCAIACLRRDFRRRNDGPASVLASTRYTTISAQAKQCGVRTCHPARRRDRVSHAGWLSEAIPWRRYAGYKLCRDTTPPRGETDARVQAHPPTSPSRQIASPLTYAPAVGWVERSDTHRRTPANVQAVCARAAALTTFSPCCAHVSCRHYARPRLHGCAPTIFSRRNQRSSAQIKKGGHARLFLLQ